MGYIEWIIATVVLGMLVYPVLQMVPSEKQKRQIALRQAAMAKGIRVQIRHPKLIQTQFNEHPEILRSVAYHLPVKETCLKKYFTAVRSAKDSEGWFWINGIRPPAATMLEMLPIYNTMPSYCLAIEQSPHGSTLFFLDTLQSCDVDEILTSLEKLNTLIVNHG